MDEENGMGVSDEKDDKEVLTLLPCLTLLKQGSNEKGSGVQRERKAKMMLLSTGRQQGLQILNFSQDLIFSLKYLLLR